ncbi:MAG: zinc-dependent peptidase [Saprospiraceae bacterium]|nr:zinc-dependent peptidase [Saprospiraceae bacterium]
MTAILILILGLIIIWLISRAYAKDWAQPKENFPTEWKQLLKEHVPYYNSLSETDQELFEYKTQEFLLNVSIVPVQTEITELDRLLVAASAVIPIFAFPEWKYKNLDEVLVYEDTFNFEYETEGEDRNILGMVGTGHMERKMILSKQALRHGFQNATDKKNTAIHEFVHLIDKSDGATDGIPKVLMEQQYVIPWLKMIERKMQEMINEKTDINPYGATSPTEFFAVITEYFFERPALLKKKHPDVYEMLCRVFAQDL